MVNLRLETDGSDGTSGLGPFLLDVDIEGTRVMPGEADEDGSAVLFIDNRFDHRLGTVEVSLLDLEGSRRAANSAGGREGVCGSDGCEEEGQTCDFHGYRVD
mmetsp:Transcript_2639/g.5094  ORF Transcript_2639/g.5094 Transcript_2639/m.5094 type:complete len:102 (-) Transcript_2639:111-416(-)